MGVVKKMGTKKLVAMTGFEPVSSDYEPDELPLLYTAMYWPMGHYPRSKDRLAKLYE